MVYSVQIKHLRTPWAAASDPDDFFDWIAEHSAIDSDARKTALRELFYCTPATGSDGSDCGHALRVLCEHFGGALDNGSWYPIGSSHFAAVGDCLRELGVPINPRDLAFSGAPVAMPEIDDFPVIGHLSRGIGAAPQEFASVGLSSIEDRAVSGSVTELRSWIDTCLEHGSDLVTFYT